MVGHSAIRRVVMGEEATARESKPEELEAMQELLRAGLDAGALGFSSSWARTHNDAGGPHGAVALRHARRARRPLLDAVGSTRARRSSSSPWSGPFEPWAVELMAAMSAGAQRPLNWNVLGVNARNLNEAEQKLEAGTYAREHGGRVVALTVPMSFPVYLSFRSGFVLDAMPGWEDVMGLPLDEKLKFFDDEEALAKLDERRPERREPAAHAGQLGEPQDPRRRRARERGVPGPHGRRDRGGGGPQRRGTCSPPSPAPTSSTPASAPSPRPTPTTTGRRASRCGATARALIGASDAGAHLDLLASFNYATEVLGKAVRQRQLLPLEEAVNLLTDVPAQLYGVKERGRVAEGWKADVVVLDPETIGSHDVRMRMDLPGGAGRLYAEADGIEHVLVNGTGIVRDGKLTESRSGQLLRSGRDTSTPSLV